MSEKFGQQKFFTHEKIEEISAEYLRLSIEAQKAGDFDRAFELMTLSRTEASTAAALKAEKLQKFTGRPSGPVGKTLKRVEFLKMAQEQISAPTQARFEEKIVKKYKNQVRNLWTRNDEINVAKILNFIKNNKF